MTEMNPVFQAIEDDNLMRVMNLLEEGVSTDIRNDDDETPLCFASRLKRYAIAEKIIAYEKQQCRKKNTEDLFWAIEKNDLDAVNEILTKDIDLKQTNAEGLTPIVLAALGKHWACVEALASNCHPEQGDKEDFGVALTLVAKNNQTHLGGLLTIHKNLQLVFDRSGGSALHHAIQHHNTELFNQLTRALPKKYLSAALPSKKAPIELAAALGYWDYVDILLNCGVRTRLEFVLCQAIFDGDLKRAKKLIDAGANLAKSIRQHDRASLLHIAVEKNNPEAVIFLQSCVVTILPAPFFYQPNFLERDALNKHGLTPLLLAVRLEHWQCVKYLAQGRNPTDLHLIKQAVLFNLLFHNVFFQERTYYQASILSRRKEILNYMMQLPVDIKQKALEKALDTTTIIGKFFAKNQSNTLDRTVFHRDRRGSVYRKKIEKALEQLYDEADHNEQSSSTRHELVPLNPL